MSTITYADRRHNVDHATRMRVRRARQLARKTEFVPVRNAKIDSAIESTQALLTIAYKEASEKNGTAMPTNAVIREEAARAVARQLPPIPIGKRTRPFISRSKY